MRDMCDMSDDNHPIGPLSIDKSNEQTINAINFVLASLINVQLRVKLARWNMQDYNYIAIQPMLDNFHTALVMHSDNIAERIFQLGGVVLKDSMNAIFDESDPLQTVRNDAYGSFDLLTGPVRGLSSYIYSFFRDDGHYDVTLLDILAACLRDVNKYYMYIEQCKLQPCRDPEAHFGDWEKNKTVE